MRVVLTVGLFIIFLTTFFILFIGSTLLKKSVTCENLGTENVDCSIETYNLEMVMSFFMVLSFLIADVGAVYLMVTSWKS